GLAGFILKSHYFPTAERSQVVCRAVPGIKAYGAITLNHSIGGINPVAVELAGRSGCKIVWMPTVDAANETAGRVDGPTTQLPFWEKTPARACRTGLRAPAALRPGRKGQHHRAGPPLPRTHRAPQHDSGHWTSRASGNFCTRKGCARNGRAEGARD